MLQDNNKSGIPNTKAAGSHKQLNNPRGIFRNLDTCSLKALLWVFVIGSAVGAIIEIVFCRFALGRWMSRSSFVWGQFSVVWGLAAVLIYELYLYVLKHPATNIALFLFGSIAGGVFEYLCSLIGEKMFGVIFWDYSGFRFNIAGRVNLTYCLYWGLATVLGVRILIPLLRRLVTNIMQFAAPAVYSFLMLFLAVNILISSLAISRFYDRKTGVAPQNKFEQSIDYYFDDEVISTIYPKMKLPRT